jgi:hypothetical protein
MRRYSILPGAIAPSGQWRFQRSDSDSDDDWDGNSAGSSVLDDGVAPGDEKEDPFRNKLDPDAAHALLLAAARAVRRMPALWMMRFVLEPPVGNNGELEVEYMVKAGTGGGGGGGRTAELVVESHPMFHPDEEVVQIWREAAEEHAGAESGLVVVVRDTRAEWAE